MKALTFHGKRDVRVDEVPDPSTQNPTDQHEDISGAIMVVLKP